MAEVEHLVPRLNEKMNSNIQIVEKPYWVSWDEIHEIVWKAHEKNREQGIFMRYPTLSGEEIRKRIEGKGKMLVAISDGTLIGTSAVVLKNKSIWCGKGKYAYCCFDSVLPEFQGTGVYKALCRRREIVAAAAGIDRMLLDTNESNVREVNVVLKNGFRRVSMKFWNDHYNIIFVKWLNGCPYSKHRCNYEYGKRKILLRFTHEIKYIFKKKA